MIFRFSTLLIVSLIVIMCFSFAITLNNCIADTSCAGGVPPNSSGVCPTDGGGGVPPNSGEGTVWILNPLKIDTVQGLIDLVLNWLLMIAIPLSTIVILYGAMLFMIYGSVPAKRKKARDVILYAVIGIVILLLAKGISYSIASFLTP